MEKMKAADSVKKLKPETKKAAAGDPI